MSIEKKEIKYPIGLQNFAKLREDGYLYVDKTSALYPLISNGGYYFLSRPRRFGKSLLLSTLEAYYQGRRDLFKGLALDSLTEDWDPHPILHLDLYNGTYSMENGLLLHLINHLDQWEKEYGQRTDAQKSLSPSDRFGNIIRSAFEKSGKKVVILIDEYDKPLLSSIGNPDLMESNRSLLKAFYSNLKTMDPYIKIAVLTGVARFSKVSIFSDLNNLRDISFEDKYAAICGITSDELYSYFKEGITSLAENLRVTDEEALDKLRQNYDGYHFAAQSPDIYNPFGLMNVFAKNKFATYWSNTGTPEFLVRIIRRGDWRIADLAPVRIEARKLESAGVLTDNPIPVLYQAGYLTIKDYDEEFDEYTLDYPNLEVRRSFWEDLVPSYLYPDANQEPFSIRNFIQEVRKGDAEGFMKRMESLIAGVPYSEKGSAESHFQNAAYLLFKLMGFYCRMEECTSDGRIDVTLEAERFVFIMEFKVDSSSRAAMEQIEEKRYWLPYQTSGKEIILIGANFDSKTRRLSPDTIIHRITSDSINL